MPYKTEKELRAKASRYLEANAVKSTCFNPSIEKNIPRFEPRGKLYYVAFIVSIRAARALT